MTEDEKAVEIKVSPDVNFNMEVKTTLASPRLAAYADKFLVSDYVTSHLLLCQKNALYICAIDALEIRRILMIILLLRGANFSLIVKLRVSSILCCDYQYGMPVIVAEQESQSSIRLHAVEYGYLRSFILHVRPLLTKNPYGAVFTQDSRPLSLPYLLAMMESSWMKSGADTEFIVVLNVFVESLRENKNNFPLSEEVEIALKQYSQEKFKIDVPNSTMEERLRESDRDKKKELAGERRKIAERPLKKRCRSFSPESSLNSKRVKEDSAYKNPNFQEQAIPTNFISGASHSRKRPNDVQNLRDVQMKPYFSDNKQKHSEILINEATKVTPTENKLDSTAVIPLIVIDDSDDTECKHSVYAIESVSSDHEIEVSKAVDVNSLLPPSLPKNYQVTKVWVEIVRKGQKKIKKTLYNKADAKKKKLPKNNVNKILNHHLSLLGLDGYVSTSGKTTMVSTKRDIVVREYQSVVNQTTLQSRELLFSEVNSNNPSTSHMKSGKSKKSMKSRKKHSTKISKAQTKEILLQGQVLKGKRNSKRIQERTMKEQLLKVQIKEEKVYSSVVSGS